MTTYYANHLDTDGAPIRITEREAREEEERDLRAIEEAERIEEQQREGYPDPEDVAGIRERERAIRWREY